MPLIFVGLLLFLGEGLTLEGGMAGNLLGSHQRCDAGGHDDLHAVDRTSWPFAPS